MAELWYLHVDPSVKNIYVIRIISRNCYENENGGYVIT